MRNFIRRITIYPIILVGAPILYCISWCFDGHEKATEYVKSILKDVWEGF